MNTIRVYVEKIDATPGGLPPIPKEDHTPGTHQDCDFSLPIEYNIEGHAYHLPVVGNSFTVMREKRNGIAVGGIFQTSRVIEVGENYFKTRNSVYKYKLL